MTFAMTSSALIVRPFAPKCAAPRRSAGDAQDLTHGLLVNKGCLRCNDRGTAYIIRESRHQCAPVWTRLSVKSLVIMHEVPFQETPVSYKDPR